jgi:hypothetical protein
MTKRLLLLGCTLALVLSSGCSLFSKKSGKSTENAAIAGDVEESFKRRWVDKRVSELTAAGTAPDAARSQANKEFGDKYEYMDRAKK